MPCRAVDEVQLWSSILDFQKMAGTYHGPGNDFFFVENTVIVNELFDLISKPGEHAYRRVHQAVRYCQRFCALDFQISKLNF